MRQRLAAILGAILLAAPASGAGILEYGLSAESPTLGRRIPYAVYTPASQPDEGERWPVVYLLHGLYGKDGDWFTKGNIGPLLDRAIEESRIPPMVVVAPGFGDSWYVDNPDEGGFGLVATALATDFVAAIDASLPTAACRRGRAIGGYSMGGWGAMLQGLNYPELYVGVMSFSGALYTPLEPDDARLSWVPDLFGNAFGDPFDRERFNAGTPFALIAQLYPRTIKPSFYQTIGDNDYWDMIEAAPVFHNRLKQARADATLVIGPGDHYWETWTRAIIPALEWLAPRLDPTCS